MTAIDFSLERNRLELLYNISRDLVSELELPDLLRRILQVTAEAVGAVSGSVLLVDDERRILDAVIYVNGKFEEDVQPRMAPLAEAGLAGWVLRNQRGAVVPNTADDERWLDTESSAAMGPRAVIAVPLLMSGQVLGLMTLSHDTAGFFDESDLELLESIADQATIAVKNAQLYAASQHQAQAMAAIAETARTLSATLDPDEVLDLLATQVMNVFDVEATSIALVDPATNELVFRVARGPAADKIIGARLPPGAGIAGWVAQTGRGVLAPGVDEDNRFYAEIDRRTGYKTRSVLCSPVQLAGATVGVIEAINPRRTQLTRSDLQLLNSMANLAGTALAHAQEYTTTHAAEQHYAGLFEDSIDPILLSDLQGVITDLNHKAEETFGYTRENLLGRSVTEIHKSDDVDWFSRLATLAVGAVASFEAFAVSANGTEKPVEIHARRIRAGDVELIQWIEHDLSERVAVEEMRSDLIAMIFHDLRSPLGNIISSLDVLEVSAPAGDEILHPVLRIASRSAARLSRLVDSLLDLRRLEAGQAVLQTETASLTALIAEAAEQVHPMSEGKDILLRVEMPSQFPTVEMDVDMMRRVLINLMENAIKYTPTGGRMHVSGSVHQAEIIVKIADTGPGIPVEEQGRIFDRFARVQREGAPKGIGLGLAFCKMAVEAHGGRIWAESQPDQGAVFSFTLPLGGRSGVENPRHISSGA